MSSEKDSQIYAFNIIAEAKMRTLVDMTKKYHPDWSIEEIKDHLERLLGYCIERVPQ
jgi:hypothetical protein